MATVTLHPRSLDHPLLRKRMLAGDWAFERLAEGYELRLGRLPCGLQTVTAVPRDVHTNESRLKRPAYRRQYSHGLLPDGGPDDAA